MTNIVYGIRLLGSTEVRYVGMTTSGMKRRLQQHFTATKRDRPYPICDWLRNHDPSLIEIFELETCENYEDLEMLEVKWMRKLLDEGNKLLNLTEGGKGPRGHKWTDEQREAHSKRMTIVNNLLEKRLAPRNQKKGVPIHTDTQKKEMVGGSSWLKNWSQKS